MPPDAGEWLDDVEKYNQTTCARSKPLDGLTLPGGRAITDIADIVHVAVTIVWGYERLENVTRGEDACYTSSTAYDTSQRPQIPYNEA